MAQQFMNFEYPSIDAEQHNASQGKCAASGDKPAGSHLKGEDGIIASVQDKHGRQPGAGGDSLASLEVTRKLKVMEVMFRLLAQEATSVEELNLMITDLSGEELWQIAEERGLSGKCGSPTCRNCCKYLGKPRLNLKKAGNAVDLVDLQCFCSVGCMQKTAALAKALGDPYDRLKSEADISAAAALLKGHPVSHGNHSKNVQAPVKDRVLGKSVEPSVRDAEMAALDLEACTSIQTTIERGSFEESVPSNEEQFRSHSRLIEHVEAVLDGQDLGQFVMPGYHFDDDDDDDDDDFRCHRKGQSPNESDSAKGELSVSSIEDKKLHRDRNEELSVFGRLYLLLDSLVSQRTISWIHSVSTDTDSSCNQLKDPSALSILFASITVEISWCSECIDEGATKDTLEKPMAQLMKTFSLISKVPVELTEIQWRVITLVLLEALSWKRSPHLSDKLSACNLLDPLLAQAGLTPFHYQALLSVLAADRVM